MCANIYIEGFLRRRDAYQIDSDLDPPCFNPVGATIRCGILETPPRF